MSVKEHAFTLARMIVGLALMEGVERGSGLSACVNMAPELAQPCIEEPRSGDWICGHRGSVMAGWVRIVLLGASGRLRSCCKR